MRTSDLVLPLLALSLGGALAGCPSQQRRNPDAGPGGTDAPLPLVDARFVMPDAFAPMGVDAAMATADAHVPADDAFAPMAADAFAGTDAFAGADAFAGTDAFAARDAFTPRNDAGPVSCTPLPATGAYVDRGDTSLTGTRWPRPVASTSCPAGSISATGTDVPYQTFVFCNEGPAGTFDIEVTADDSDLYDSYLVIYDGTGIPSDPLACIEADDDTGADGPLVTGLSIAAGQTITLVVTGFDNADAGGFSFRVERL